MNFEIRIKGIALDLFKSSDFYINKLVHDLSDLETRDASNASSIKIPYSLRNARILNIELPELGHAVNTPYSLIECEVLLSGLQLIEDAVLKVDSTNKTEIQISFFGGAVRFFEALKDEPISLLNWSEFDMEWEPDNIELIANTTDGICYADSTWLTNGSISHYTGLTNQDISQPDLSYSGFFVYLKKIMQKIFDSILNLTIDYSIIDTDFFNRLAISAPMYMLSRSYKANESIFFAEVKTNENQPIYGNLQAYRVPFPNIISDDLGLWNNITHIFLITKNSIIEVNASFPDTFISKTLPGIFGATIFEVWHNNDIISSARFAAIDSDKIHSFSLSAVINGRIGDIIYINVSTGMPEDVPKVLLNANFRINEAGTYRGRLITTSEWIPEISQKDFIKEIFKIFHLIPIEQNNIVTLKKWEQLNTELSQDLSENIDISKEQTLTGSIGSYAQKNRFHYSDNDEVLRYDVSEELPMAADYLAEKLDKLSLIFSGTDESFVGLDGKVTIPTYQIEHNIETDNNITITNGSTSFSTQEKTGLKKGNLIYIDNGSVVRRVVNMEDDVSGRVDINWPHGGTEQNWHFSTFEENKAQIHLVSLQDMTNFEFRDGGILRNVPNAKKAVFIDAMSMTSLVEENYKLFKATILKPVIMQAYFKFSLVDFLNLDLLKPVYISYTNQKYYINKIDQYKQDKSTRLELIQLGQAIDQSQNVQRDYTISPTNSNMGNWQGGDPLPEQIYTLENTGLMDLVLVQTLEGENPNDFIIVSGGGEFDLIVGATRLVTLRYTGINIPGNRSCEIVINNAYLQPKKALNQISVENIPYDTLDLTDTGILQLVNYDNLELTI